MKYTLKQCYPFKIRVSEFINATEGVCIPGTIKGFYVRRIVKFEGLDVYFMGRRVKEKGWSAKNARNESSLYSTISQVSAFQRQYGRVGVE